MDTIYLNECPYCHTFVNLEGSIKITIKNGRLERSTVCPSCKKEVPTPTYDMAHVINHLNDMIFDCLCDQS